MGHLVLSSSTSRSVFNSFIIHLIILFCLSFFPITTIATSRLGGNYTDEQALLAFKAQISDPLGVLTSWNKTTHFCQWLGVRCGRRHQRVTRLVLESYELGGSISPQIGNLSFVRILGLANNSLSRVIPQEIGRLRRLQILALNNNSISGEIPANLSHCSNLIGVNFAYNNLVGEIPHELGSLKKIQKIYILNNNLVGGIPHSFANLSSLEELSAYINHLGGSIPDGLGQLKRLTYISLRENGISGTIPPSIFNISSLEVFDVALNFKLIGSLPSEIGYALPNLQYLAVSGNQFTGSIPISISNATNLEVLAISENNLTGKVPPIGRLNKLTAITFSRNYLESGGLDDSSLFSSLNNATDLRWFSMDGNNFGGKLMDSFSNFSTKLEMFSIANNHIVGKFPSGIENLIELSWLSMWGNELTGAVPSEIGSLGKLSQVFLSDNKFSGYVPHTLANLSLLTKLNLGRNYLHGGIPSSLGKCQDLMLLDLSRNNLSGTIPPEVISLSSLSSYLDLSHNNLTGSLPGEVGSLRNLGALAVSDNMLSGKIPSTIGSCVRLEFLYMGNNLFQGNIPSSMSALRGIRELVLSHNNLSGSIPEYFESFNSLQILNLSYNDFEGVVPINGMFMNASVISVVGNSKLCGGIPELNLTRCNYGGDRKSKLTHSLKWIIPTTLGLLGLILGFGLLYPCWCKKRRGKPSSENSQSLFLKVSYQSLYKATDGFSQSKLVGVGSFGTVYEGILDPDRKKVAVKVLNLSHRGASKSFIAECEALRNIRHRNLVKVISVCAGADNQNNDFKALVYEFMANGNLDEWLHLKHLSPVWRLDIAIDVASALDYLHHRCHDRIVHCDLKPNNVLLDNDMMAHVGDFGLARILLDANSNISANQTSSIGIRGTVGYAAPEYGMGNPVSTSGDVYSYGILLLEMFTGKRPTDEMFSEGLNLHEYAKSALPERVAEIVDPVFIQEMNSDQINCGGPKIQEWLVSIFEIGIACSEELPSERPNIADVVAKLRGVKDNLLLGERKTTNAAQS